MMRNARMIYDKMFEYAKYSLHWAKLSIQFFSLSLSYTFHLHSLSLTLTLFYFFCCLCQPWKAFRQMWITACLPACHTLSAYGFIGNWGEEKEEERWKFNQYLFNIHLNLLLSTMTKKKCVWLDEGNLNGEKMFIF